ncbi:flagellar assembly peptidoglycan hydrolase FlgJ [Thiomonas sp.]|jgi:flagellar protein FlgJ|uniref:flagellar assembly peptidoglycan hydrolase FlgJ n=1 Tax=Thiomonas sp. TaxID=2047785 RepID=UPI002635DDEF|nr:flagellar assembly peptidoglycan hydrolase FlgJ [Thiomonas sp.]
MTAPLLGAASAQATDSLSFQGLNQLQALAQANPQDPATIRAVSRQFEALLVQQLLKSANAVKLGPDLLGDSGGPMFESMFNQQVADVVSQGPGLGLGSYLARELAARYGAAAHPGDAAAGSGSAAVSGGVAGPSHTLPDHARAPAAAPVAAPLASSPGASKAADDLGTDSSNAADDEALQRRARAFIAAIAPSARAAAQALGVSPVGILAQAALETGWGRHAPGNNLFGIKAGTDWQGPSLHELSSEVSNGVRTLGDAAFRAYRSVAASVHDYASLLESPRYAPVRGHGDDLGAFAQGLQRAGYATDPGYARKLLQVADSPTMRDALAALGSGAAGSSFALP